VVAGTVGAGVVGETRTLEVVSGVEFCDRVRLGGSLTGAVVGVGTEDATCRSCGCGCARGTGLGRDASG
jgi:hypothetical protein